MWTRISDGSLESVEKESEGYSPLTKRLKPGKQSWTEKSMLEALNCCKNQELGIEEASLIYGIPKRSLRYRLKDKNFSVIDDKYRIFVLPVFPNQAELELVELLQDMVKCQFTFTSIEIRRLAYELASEKFYLNDLPQEKDCLLGNRWFKTFMAKYPHLETENSIPPSLYESSERFYNSLEKIIADNGIEPDRTFCVDGIELKFRASNADDFDKIYHRRKIIYTDAKALCCISASGLFTPPLFIKPDEKGNDGGFAANHTSYGDNKLSHLEVDESISSSKIDSAYDKLKDLCESDSRLLPTAKEVIDIKNQIKAHLNKKTCPVTGENEEALREKLYEQFNRLRNKIISKYESSLNVISCEIFYKWFMSFVANVKCNSQRKVILLLGEQNHVKHLKTLQLAKSSGVIFLVLPPHSIHKIYPLDGFAMSLNRNLSTCASVWLGKNPNIKIQDVPLHALFNGAYKNTVNPTIAKNGFIYSGIWPVNRNIFETSELGGESILLKDQLYISHSTLEKKSMNSKTNSFNLGFDNRIINIDKLCRVCMKEKMYMKPLFDSSVANYHGKKISDIIGRPISVNDGLPRGICQYCLVQLMDVIKIKNIADETNKKMKDLRDMTYECLCERNESNRKTELSELQYQILKSVNSESMDKLLTKDFDKNSVCRVCMSNKPLMTSIFHSSQKSSKGGSDFSYRITEVLNSQINIDDGFSSSICAFCRASINQAWDFVHKVLSSDKRFQEILTASSTSYLE